MIAAPRPSGDRPCAHGGLYPQEAKRWRKCPYHQRAPGEPEGADGLHGVAELISRISRRRRPRSFERCAASDGHRWGPRPVGLSPFGSIRMCSGPYGWKPNGGAWAISPSSTSCLRSTSDDGAAPEPVWVEEAGSQSVWTPRFWFHLGSGTPRRWRRKGRCRHGGCSVLSRDTSSCVSVRSSPSRLLVSGSRVRVLDGPPLASGTPGARGARSFPSPRR